MFDLLQYPKTVTCVLLVLQVVLGKVWGRRRRSYLPLPPGPKGYPILGNFFDIPTTHIEHGYSQLLNRYGDMVYLEAFGAKILVLGSTKRTTDLFEKRSSIHSDRPEIPMFSMMGFTSFFSLMRYGSGWRRQRKMFHAHFNPTVVPLYHPLILEERANYIRDLLADPAAFWERTRTYFSRVILRATYAIEPKDNDDPFIRNPQLVGEGFSIAGRPGAFMVDFIPVLKYVPDWMPGTGWKKLARYYNGASWRTRVLPFEHVHKLQRQGTATPSIALSLIQDLPNEDDPGFEEQVRSAQGTTGIAYIGGADTSLGLALAALNLLTIHSDIQKRVQDEIDQFVGLGRLPDFNDREQLVYLRAVLKEVARIYQVFPVGVAHAAVEDDIYDGYFIPKGTIVFGHSWHMLHNPDIYPDPFTFNPDRFLQNGRMRKDILDPYSTAFGFGRRICPGRHFSHDTVFALISSVLAYFELSPPKDDNGINIPLKWELEEGVLVLPKRFQCEFTPRTPSRSYD
ncbi:O-methylsterigmatocystin oxidoreductase [Coprinellus micaceus]|uniref:O-methylsterigmatocystin oxidoreductase n=1 Tax=Coprinellus micaceus TaxID=71717 RepID=A0A4Y7TJ00_COPMI|nr:O-methylsterigmatocystin oxidoreductase [Coprinellus micaceus]